MRAQLNNRLRKLERMQAENERKLIQRSHAIEHELARRMASWKSWDDRRVYDDRDEAQVEQELRAQLEYRTPRDLTSKEGRQEWERIQAAPSYQDILAEFDLMREDVIKG
jgi:hypothetical protein